MLGKLLKYELKATARIFLPLLLLLVVLTPLTKLIMSLDIFHGFAKFIPALTLMLYVCIVIAVCVSAFIFMVYRFYKNFMTEEGYLMFTLPVSVHSLVLSKAIISFFWTILCYAASLLSIVFVIYEPEWKDQFVYYYEVISDSLHAEANFSLTAFIVWTAILLVISQIHTIFYAYVSIAIGQLYGKHKILGAIAAAFVIYLIMYIISFAVTLPLSLSIDESNLNAIFTSLYPASAAVSVISTAIYYFITTYLLQKKLNLN